jgi:hypothetical protein
MKLKVGDFVSSKKLKGRALVRGIKGEDILVECEKREDGLFQLCPSMGVQALQRCARLRWCKRKDLDVTTQKPEIRGKR